MTREEAVSIIEERVCVTEYVDSSYVDCVDIEALRIAIKALTQPEYEELTPGEAASKIASRSIMSAWYWLDLMIRLNQMGYAICRRREE